MYDNILLTLPILSNRITSSLFNSQRSLDIGFLKTAPERLVTGKPQLN